MCLWQMLQACTLLHPGLIPFDSVGLADASARQAGEVIFENAPKVS